MPPSWFDQFFPKPVPSTEGLPPLATTPLTATNPGLAKLRDLIGGAIGTRDALDPTSSNATMLGSLVASLLPVAAAVKAGRTAEQGAVQGIRAYHGSPHDFERFDLSKIGTGEGAQMHGPGHYLAEAPDVARSYRDMVPVGERVQGLPLDTNLRIGGKPLEEVYAALDRQAARLPIKQAEPLYERLSILEDLGQTGDPLGVRDRGTHSAAALAWFDKEVVPNFTRRGKLYEVSINAEAKDFLHLDEPLSAQPSKVQDLVREGLKAQGFLGPNDNGPRQLQSALKAWKMQYGSMINTSMESLLGGGHGGKNGLLGNSAEEVADRLKAAGVKGLKYLDQGSRDAGKGTYNYVIYDDALLDIKNKYGVTIPQALLIQQWFEQRDKVKAQAPKGDINLPREGDINLPKQTILAPGDEPKFQAWYADAAKKLNLNPDPDDPRHHYDYRQAFQQGVRVPANPSKNWHFPSDAGKADDHPNVVVGGFDTRTGQRVPGTRKATSVQEMVDLGWNRADAIRLLRQKE